MCTQQLNVGLGISEIWGWEHAFALYLFSLAHNLWATHLNLVYSKTRSISFFLMKLIYFFLSMSTGISAAFLKVQDQIYRIQTRLNHLFRRRLRLFLLNLLRLLFISYPIFISPLFIYNRFSPTCAQCRKRRHHPS